MILRSILASVVAGTIVAALAPDARAAPAQSGAPTDAAEQSWVALTGAVGSMTGDGFTLDYAGGPVTVALGNGGAADEIGGLRPGKEVTVYGKADAALFAHRRFAASSVYVYDGSAYHFVGDGKAEDDTGYLHVPSYTMTPRDYSDGSFVTVSGTVTAIDGRDFTLDVGTQPITVDTAQMRFNPLDAEGYQQIATGDDVTVTGNVDSRLFDDRQLVAHAIVSDFHDDSGLTMDAGRPDGDQAGKQVGAPASRPGG